MFDLFFAKKFKIYYILIGALVASLAGCASRIGGSDYAVAGTGEINDVAKGVIVGKRNVHINAKDSEHQNEPGLGAATGLIGGGLLGSQIGSGSGSVAGLVVGGLASAVVGHFAEKALTNQDGFEYQIQLDNGRLITLVQGKDPELNVHQRVLVLTPTSSSSTYIQGGQRVNTSRSRVVADETCPAH